MNRLALFDCDGTLADSGANICRAMEESFATHGLTPPPQPAIRRIVGLSLVEAMAVLHPAGEASHHHALAEDYKRCFRSMRGTASFQPEPLYDGIVEALDALAEHGWVLGVATGKSDRGLAMLLAHHGLADRFVTLQTADRHPSKPHPSMALTAIAEAGASPGTTVMIGDTAFDMAMGRAARTHVVGVGWGYHPPDELLATGAGVVVEHARDLPAAVLACMDGIAISQA